ncbi:hypothetical protein M440DRAFT_1391385 [Trichoderma longibrachiatum ATCC 18648]|uniref:Uncharacterized protein n=1 Tax=Trichoderma longibrachiatum ATCC 18648 TaxID=983965 RepID=A0A2T4C5J5_TRILO|nr:hypothetical protein M440DRAFT_1391385 [Trichoderma longibrachiatum ATCC 18648]
MPTSPCRLLLLLLLLLTSNPTSPIVNAYGLPPAARPACGCHFTLRLDTLLLSQVLRPSMLLGIVITRHGKQNSAQREQEIKLLALPFNKLNYGGNATTTTLPVGANVKEPKACKRLISRSPAQPSHLWYKATPKRPQL